MARIKIILRASCFIFSASLTGVKTRSIAMEGESVSSELKCICCGKHVVRSNARRRVGGPSSKRLVPVFLEFFRTVFPGCTFLPRDFCADSRLFWCKGCFSKLERVLKVREDGKKLENEIVGHIKSVGAQFITERTTDVAVSPAPSTPRRKRQLSSLREDDPSPKRWRRIGTPEQRVLSRTVVTGTPCVSVSSVRDARCMQYYVTVIM